MSTLVVICNDLDYFLRHRAEVPARLSREGHQVIVATGGRKETHIEGLPLQLKHIPISRFSFNPIMDCAIALRSFLLFIRTRPKVVHLITLKPAIYSGLAALATKALGRGPENLLITIPGLGRLMSPSSRMMGTRAILARRLIGLAFKFISSRSCSHFTFETQHDREIFLNQGLVKPENSTVIKGAGVDPELFYAKSQEDFTLPLKFLFASRLLKSKGLEAFLIAADRYADQAVVKFVVAGMVEPEDPDGYSATELADNSSITFLGEETDMPSLLRKVDLVCLPTLYGEGIPRILIEASACGVASLATDVAGCNEVVKNGKTGFLIRAGKPTEMADEIESILIQYVESPKLLRDHSEAALALFQSGDFSQASVTGRFIELLKVA